MSEQNTNHESPEQNVAHDNIEHSDSILEETMKEFDPKHNSGEEMTIENEIDIDTFKARIAELEGEVKQAKEVTARANAEAYNAQKRMEQEADKSKRFALQKFAKELLEVVDMVDPQGEKFNADLHEAVGIDEEAEADTVGTVLQKGYSLNGRLLRPAMVRVGQ